MEQNINTDQRDFFSGIIANPEAIDAVHAPQLKMLVELYPQSGILRAMLARASQVYDQGSFQQKLKSAAVYAPDRAVLYNLINYPEKLVKYVEPFNEIEDEEEDVSLFEDDYSGYQHDEEVAEHDEESVYESEPINYFHESEEVFQHTFEDRTNLNPVAEPKSAEPQLEYISYNFPPPENEGQIVEPVDNDFADNVPPVYQPSETVEQPAPEYPYSVPAYQPEEVSEPAVISDYDYTPPYREVVEEPQAPAGYTYSTSPEPFLPPIPGYYAPLSYQEQIARAASEIDDEVYDEITGIEDIYFDPIVKPRSNVPDISDIEDHIESVEHTGEFEDIILAQYGEQTTTVPLAPEHHVNVQPELANVELEEYDYSTTDEDDGTPISQNDEVDFEMVDEAVAEPAKPIIQRPLPPAQQAPVAAPPVDVQPQFSNDNESRVSKYNDDKMPYSFMWWLDKTRKEHAESHQPYVAFKPIISEVPRPAVNDELQHQYFENIFHITSVEQLDMNTRDKRKESEIVDRFIQKDPQLKPPNTEKLDNENKAKKSAEDKNELVSETLARIYLDQMLYTKAIATYQKLLLKFPEKSSYFVAQIKLLEKKIN